MVHAIGLLLALQAPPGRSVLPPAGEPPLARLLVPGRLQAILSVGDTLPDGEPWAPAPDGIGGYAEGEQVVLYVNHELSAGGVPDAGGTSRFPWARVSKLTLERETLALRDATWVVTGRERYQAFCSATWVGAAEGFPSGFLLTGEEALGGPHDGIQLAIGRDGVVHELPWLGRYRHENTIGVPWRSQVVLVGTDDSGGASELYLYVARDEGEVLRGGGRLYVLAAGGGALSRPGELAVGQQAEAVWVEVPGAAALSSGELESTVRRLGALRFSRLEDLDYDRRPGGTGRRPGVWFVDTGGAGVLCGLTPCDRHGSIYYLSLDPARPEGPARLSLVARSAGAGAGWASPDNIAVTATTLMLQEDPAHPAFARAPGIWRIPITGEGRLGTPREVIELDNRDCLGALLNCWESSGIVDASAWFGPEAWVFTIQAHSLPAPRAGLPRENGQLLLVRFGE